MMSLNYYLSKSASGDKNAAYEAAKIMHLEKYNEVMVQAQLRKAASLGSVDAIRWLGFLGLSGNLIIPSSTVSNITYYNTYKPAYDWFAEGSKKGDALSTFVVGICIQHGIGATQDPQKSDAIMSKVLGDVSTDVVVSIIYLLNSIHPAEHLQSHSIDQHFVDNILKNA